MSRIGAAFDTFIGMEIISIAMFAALMLAERVLTRRSISGNPPAGRLTDFWYWTSAPIVRQLEKWLVASALAFAAVWLGTSEPSALTAGFGPLSRLPWPLAALVAVVVSEFCSYWLHRAMHQVPFLWRFHRIHHSSTTLRWSSAGRTHPVNEVFNYLAGLFPCLLVGVPLHVVVTLLPVMTMWSVMSHSNQRWNFGPLRGWLVSPRFHGWHHTHSSEGGDMNFANILSIFDRLFGTFYMPHDRMPQRFGLDDTIVPEDYLKQLVLPFQPGDR
ncbi:MAG TPA: sterol desaturase family protein [Polyangiales bacterium]|nr:sterol desaturase family protein [Polyangiales bacterium]